MLARTSIVYETPQEMSHGGKAGIEEMCNLGHTGQFEWILLVALWLRLFVVFVKIFSEIDDVVFTFVLVIVMIFFEIDSLLVFLMMLVNISIL